MPKIQAVFFDLGDTLVRISHSTENEICERIGKVRGTPLPIEEYTSICRDEWLRRSNSTATNSVKNITIDAEERERQYWENYFESLLPFLGIYSKQPELVKWLIDTYTDPHSFVCFDDVYPLLFKLREQRLALGIISNAFPSAERILDHLHLRQYFKYVFLSFELPYAKPDVMFYQFAAMKADIPVENTVFVDDRWSFVKGAQDASMNAWLIERSADVQSGFFTKSLVRKIKSLTELIMVLNLSTIDDQVRDEDPLSIDCQGELWNYCKLPTNNASFFEDMNYAGRKATIPAYFSRLSG